MIKVLASIVILFVLVICFFIWYPFEKDYDKYIIKLNSLDYSDDSLVDLEQLPGLAVNDDSLGEISCDDFPKFLGTNDADYTKMCFDACGGSGSIIQVLEGESIIFNGEYLKPGFWCAKNKKLSCNQQTSNLVKSATSYVCNPKYPNLFGGIDGNTVVACSSAIYESRGILRDRKNNNVQVNPRTVTLSSELEKFNNLNRFYCDYSTTIKERLIVHPGASQVPILNFKPHLDPCFDYFYPSDTDKGFVNNKCQCANYDEDGKCVPCKVGQLPCRRIFSRTNKISLPICPDFDINTTECFTKN